METKKADNIAELFPDENILQIDGFDDCIIGYVHRCGQGPILCYDENAIIDKIMKDHECDWDDAVDHFEFNIAGAWMGDSTPCFLVTADLEDIEYEAIH